MIGISAYRYYVIISHNSQKNHPAVPKYIVELCLKLSRILVVGF